MSDSYPVKFKYFLYLLVIFILSISQPANSQSKETSKQLNSDDATISNSVAFNFKPRSSSELLRASEPIEMLPDRLIQTEIEVLVPIFDPNIPDGDSAREKAGIWPELRRVEAATFAKKIKKELEATNAFGAVRIIPNLEAMKDNETIKDVAKTESDITKSDIMSVGIVGDLYVIGKINSSSGEYVDINIQVVGIDGSEWLNRNYKKYYPNSVFQKAAADIAGLFEAKSTPYLENLDVLSEIYFGYQMSADYFEDYLDIKNDNMKLVRIPAYDDPMYQRMRRLRIEDQLFIDNMQQTYQNFNKKTEESYQTWQQKAQALAKAIREAKAEATRRRAEVQAEAERMKAEAEEIREQAEAQAERIRDRAEEERREADEEAERAREKAENEAMFGSIVGGLLSIWGASENNAQVMQGGLNVIQIAQTYKAEVYEETAQDLDDAARQERAEYRRADEIEETAVMRMEQQLTEIEQDLQRILNDKQIFGEADFHYKTLMNLGKSIDLEVEPHVIEYEGRVIKLTGNTAKQFNQWRRSLMKIYAEEKTPAKEL